MGEHERAVFQDLGCTTTCMPLSPTLQSTVRPAAADSRSLTSCGGLAAIARTTSDARFCREIASHDEIAGRLALVLAKAYTTAARPRLELSGPS